MSHHPVGPARVSGDGYTITENASLLGRNSLHVAARAALLVEVRQPHALRELFGYQRFQRDDLVVLGEGSNTLFAGDVDGVVLALATRGIRTVGERDGHAVIRAEAGESWNDFVHWSLAHGHVGIENLVLIPGTVGAVPIQNIGAYGVEAGEFIDTVEAWDRHANGIVRLDHAACAFGYRDSLFKRDPARYVITAVEFRLPREAALKLDYAGVREELAALGFDQPRAVHVAEAIARIRTRKLPDPALVGNAGSFFKNPLVDAATAARLRNDHPTLPQWPADDGLHKLSAAWMIENAGLKGWRDGAAGVSDQHALVLVNHGGASGAQLLGVARHVIATVHDRFGVTLEPEPRIVGADSASAPDRFRSARPAGSPATAATSPTSDRPDSGR